jgi:[ribosomal protein S5]-alanine N-acetyltransferase
MAHTTIVGMILGLPNAEQMNFLETGRLLFRVHQLEDQPDFVSRHTDPEVRRFVGGSAWPAEKAVQRFRAQHLGQPSHTYGLWATILKSDDRFIGSCGLRAPDGQHPPSLAFYLARPYWGASSRLRRLARWSNGHSVA